MLIKSEQTNPSAIDWREIDALRKGLATPKLAVTHAEGDQVKLVTYNFNDRKRFPKALPRVELLHLTDLQVGSKNFIEKRFLEYRAWMLSEPYRFGLLGGDIVDAATILSVGSPYENTKEPLYQVRDAVALLKPLADAGRLLGYVGGNHERRTAKTYGDCGLDIAQRLGVPYSGGIQFLELHYGKHDPFAVALWHGGGASRTKGAKAQVLDRFMNQGDAQLYLIGHLHDAIVLPGWKMRRVNGRIKLQKVMGAMSSSFMSYWNAYSEHAAMPPSETMMARAILEPSGRWELTLR